MKLTRRKILALGAAALAAFTAIFSQRPPAARASARTIPTIYIGATKLAVSAGPYPASGDVYVSMTLDSDTIGTDHMFVTYSFAPVAQPNPPAFTDVGISRGETSAAVGAMAPSTSVSFTESNVILVNGQPVVTAKLKLPATPGNYTITAKQTDFDGTIHSISVLGANGQPAAITVR